VSQSCKCTASYLKKGFCWFGCETIHPNGICSNTTAYGELNNTCRNTSYETSNSAYISIEIKNCLHQDTLATLSNGTIVELKNLVIGDSIKVSENEYEPVIVIIKHFSNDEVPVLKLSLNASEDRQLVLTPDHYVITPYNGHVLARNLK
jgi:hypothetical protein